MLLIAKVILCFLVSGVLLESVYTPLKNAYHTNVMWSKVYGITESFGPLIPATFAVNGMLLRPPNAQFNIMAPIPGRVATCVSTTTISEGASRAIYARHNQPVLSTPVEGAAFSIRGDICAYAWILLSADKLTFFPKHTCLDTPGEVYVTSDGIHIAVEGKPPKFYPLTVGPCTIPQVFDGTEFMPANRGVNVTLKNGVIVSVARKPSPYAFASLVDNLPTTSNPTETTTADQTTAVPSNNAPVQTIPEVPQATTFPPKSAVDQAHLESQVPPSQAEKKVVKEGQVVSEKHKAPVLTTNADKVRVACSPGKEGCRDETGRVSVKRQVLVSIIGIATSLCVLLLLSFIKAKFGNVPAICILVLVLAIYFPVANAFVTGSEEIVEDINIWIVIAGGMFPLALLRATSKRDIPASRFIVHLLLVVAAGLLAPRVYAETTCSGDGLIFQSTLFESTGTSKVYEYKGVVAPGTCIRAGTNTIAIKDVKKHHNYLYEGTVPMNLSLSVDTAYGCPGGKASSICGRSVQLPSDEWHSRVCPFKRNAPFDGTDCALPGDVFFDVVITVCKEHQHPHYVNVYKLKPTTHEMEVHVEVNNGEHHTFKVPDNNPFQLKDGTTIQVPSSYTVKELLPEYIIQYKGEWFSAQHGLDFNSVCVAKNAKKPLMFSDPSCVHMTQHFGYPLKSVVDYQKVHAAGWFINSIDYISNHFGDLVEAKNDDGDDVVEVKVSQLKSYIDVVTKTPMFVEEILCSIQGVEIGSMTQGENSYFKKAIVPISVSAFNYPCVIHVRSTPCDLLSPERLTVSSPLNYKLGFICDWSTTTNLSITASNGTTYYHIDNLARNFVWNLYHGYGKVESIIEGSGVRLENMGENLKGTGLWCSNLMSSFWKTFSSVFTKYLLPGAVGILGVVCITNGFLFMGVIFISVSAAQIFLTGVMACDGSYDEFDPDTFLMLCWLILSRLVERVGRDFANMFGTTPRTFRRNVRTLETILVTWYLVVTFSIPWHQVVLLYVGVFFILRYVAQPRLFAHKVYVAWKYGMVTDEEEKPDMLTAALWKFWPKQRIASKNGIFSPLPSKQFTSFGKFDFECLPPIGVNKPLIQDGKHLGFYTRIENVVITASHLVGRVNENLVPLQILDDICVIGEVTGDDFQTWFASFQEDCKKLALKFSTPSDKIFRQSISVLDNTFVLTYNAGCVTAYHDGEKVVPYGASGYVIWEACFLLNYIHSPKVCYTTPTLDSEDFYRLDLEGETEIEEEMTSRGRKSVSDFCEDWETMLSAHEGTTFQSVINRYPKFQVWPVVCRVGRREFMKLLEEEAIRLMEYECSMFPIHRKAPALFEDQSTRDLPDDSCFESCEAALIRLVEDRFEVDNAMAKDLVSKTESYGPMSVRKRLVCKFVALVGRIYGYQNDGNIHFGCLSGSMIKYIVSQAAENFGRTIPVFDTKNKTRIGNSVQDLVVYMADSLFSKRAVAVGDDSILLPEPKRKPWVITGVIPNVPHQPKYEPEDGWPLLPHEDRPTYNQLLRCSDNCRESCAYIIARKSLDAINRSVEVSKCLEKIKIPVMVERLLTAVAHPRFFYEIPKDAFMPIVGPCTRIERVQKVREFITQTEIVDDTIGNCIDLVRLSDYIVHNYLNYPIGKLAPVIQGDTSRFDVEIELASMKLDLSDLKKDALRQKAEEEEKRKEPTVFPKKGWFDQILDTLVFPGNPPPDFSGTRGVCSALNFCFTGDDNFTILNQGNQTIGEEWETDEESPYRDTVYAMAKDSSDSPFSGNKGLMVFDYETGDISPFRNPGQPRAVKKRFIQAKQSFKQDWENFERRPGKSATSQAGQPDDSRTPSRAVSTSSIQSKASNLDSSLPIKKRDLSSRKQVPVDQNLVKANKQKLKARQKWVPIGAKQESKEDVEKPLIDLSPPKRSASQTPSRTTSVSSVQSGASSSTSKKKGATGGRSVFDTTSLKNALDKTMDTLTDMVPSALKADKPTPTPRKSKQKTMVFSRKSDETPLSIGTWTPKEEDFRVNAMNKSARDDTGKHIGYYSCIDGIIVTAGHLIDLNVSGFVVAQVPGADDHFMLWKQGTKEQNKSYGERSTEISEWLTGGQNLLERNYTFDIKHESQVYTGLISGNAMTILQKGVKQVVPGLSGYIEMVLPGKWFMITRADKSKTIWRPHDLISDCDIEFKLKRTGSKSDWNLRHYVNENLLLAKEGKFTLTPILYQRCLLEAIEYMTNEENISNETELLFFLFAENLLCTYDFEITDEFEHVGEIFLYWVKNEDETMRAMYFKKALSAMYAQKEEIDHDQDMDMSLILPRCTFDSDVRRRIFDILGVPFDTHGPVPPGVIYHGLESEYQSILLKIQSLEKELAIPPVQIDYGDTEHQLNEVETERYLQNTGTNVYNDGRIHLFSVPGGNGFGVDGKFTSNFHVVGSGPLQFTPVKVIENVRKNLLFEYIPTSYSKTQDVTNYGEVPLATPNKGELCVIFDLNHGWKRYCVCLTPATSIDAAKGQWSRFRIIDTVRDSDGKAIGWVPTRKFRHRGTSGALIASLERDVLVGRYGNVCFEGNIAKKILHPIAVSALSHQIDFGTMFGSHAHTIVNQLPLPGYVGWKIVAGTGTGKTTTLAHEILKALYKLDMRGLVRVVVAMPTQSSVRSAYGSASQRFCDEWIQVQYVHGSADGTVHKAKSPEKGIFKGELLYKTAAMLTAKDLDSRTVLMIDEQHLRLAVLLAVEALVKAGLLGKPLRIVTASATPIADPDFCQVGDEVVGTRMNIEYHEMKLVTKKEPLQNGWVKIISGRDDVRKEASVPLSALVKQKVLIFYPTIRSLRAGMAHLKKQPGCAGLEHFEFHGKTPHTVMDQITSSQYCVVHCTNVFESSVTIDGMSVVIDWGLENRMRCTPPIINSDGIDYRFYATVGPCSKQAQKQRAGRTGRTCDGRVYRYPDQSHTDAEVFPDAETWEAALWMLNRYKGDMGFYKTLNQLGNSEQKPVFREAWILHPMNMPRGDGSMTEETWAARLEFAVCASIDPVGLYLAPALPASIKDNLRGERATESVPIFSNTMAVSKFAAYFSEKNFRNTSRGREAINECPWRFVPDHEYETVKEKMNFLVDSPIIKPKETMSDSFLEQIELGDVNKSAVEFLIAKMTGTHFGTKAIGDYDLNDKAKQRKIDDKKRKNSISEVLAQDSDLKIMGGTMVLGAVGIALIVGQASRESRPNKVIKSCYFARSNIRGTAQAFPEFQIKKSAFFGSLQVKYEEFKDWISDMALVLLEKFPNQTKWLRNLLFNLATIHHDSESEMFIERAWSKVSNLVSKDQVDDFYGLLYKYKLELGLGAVSATLGFLYDTISEVFGQAIAGLCSLLLGSWASTGSALHMAIAVLGQGVAYTCQYVYKKSKETFGRTVKSRGKSLLFFTCAGGLLYQLFKDVTTDHSKVQEEFERRINGPVTDAIVSPSNQLSSGVLLVKSVCHVTINALCGLKGEADPQFSLDPTQEGFIPMFSNAALCYKSYKELGVQGTMVAALLGFSLGASAVAFEWWKKSKAENLGNLKQGDIATTLYRNLEDLDIMPWLRLLLAGCAITANPLSISSIFIHCTMSLIESGFNLNPTQSKGNVEIIRDEIMNWSGVSPVMALVALCGRGFYFVSACNKQMRAEKAAPMAQDSDIVAQLTHSMSDMFSKITSISMDDARQYLSSMRELPEWCIQQIKETATEAWLLVKYLAYRVKHLSLVLMDKAAEKVGQFTSHAASEALASVVGTYFNADLGVWLSDKRDKWELDYQLKRAIRYKRGDPMNFKMYKHSILESYVTEVYFPRLEGPTSAIDVLEEQVKEIWLDPTTSERISNNLDACIKKIKESGHVMDNGNDVVRDVNLPILHRYLLYFQQIPAWRKVITDNAPLKEYSPASLTQYGECLVARRAQLIQNIKKRERFDENFEELKRTAKTMYALSILRASGDGRSISFDSLYEGVRDVRETLNDVEDEVEGTQYEPAPEAFEPQPSTSSGIANPSNADKWEAVTALAPKEFKNANKLDTSLCGEKATVAETHRQVRAEVYTSIPAGKEIVTSTLSILLSSRMDRATPEELIRVAPQGEKVVDQFAAAWGGYTLCFANPTVSYEIPLPPNVFLPPPSVIEEELRTSLGPGWNTIGKVMSWKYYYSSECFVCVAKFGFLGGAYLVGYNDGAATKIKFSVASNEYVLTNVPIFMSMFIGMTAGVVKRCQDFDDDAFLSKVSQLNLAPYSCAKLLDPKPTVVQRTLGAAKAMVGMRKTTAAVEWNEKFLQTTDAGPMFNNIISILSRGEFTQFEPDMLRHLGVLLIASTTHARAPVQHLVESGYDSITYLLRQIGIFVLGIDPVKFSASAIETSQYPAKVKYGFLGHMSILGNFSLLDCDHPDDQINDFKLEEEYALRYDPSNFMLAAFQAKQHVDNATSTNIQKRAYLTALSAGVRVVIRGQNSCKSTILPVLCSDCFIHFDREDVIHNNWNNGRLRICSRHSTRSFSFPGKWPKRQDAIDERQICFELCNLGIYATPDEGLKNAFNLSLFAKDLPGIASAYQKASKLGSMDHLLHYEVSPSARKGLVREGYSDKDIAKELEVLKKLLNTYYRVYRHEVVIEETEPLALPAPRVISGAEARASTSSTSTIEMAEEAGDENNNQ